ncbi:MAG: SDR family NAD(P)-dependent oxidoreductase [Propionibacteriaceae bacterium]|jgi:short-subunit dehydrogenase|nr:SDR family NAD(P)-dependent oxidoreductase [Propionibacteriaceae bacterium]
MHNKAVIITGHTSGLGAELAKLFEARGYMVVGVSRSRATTAGSRIHIQGSVADPHTIDQVVTEISRRGLIVEALINSAGIGNFGPVGDYTAAQISDVIDSSLTGPILLTNAIVKMWNQVKQDSGYIVNILSTAAFTARGGEAVYCAAKAGLKMFGDALRLQMKGSPFTVINIMPGGMNTPFWSGDPKASSFMSVSDVALIILQSFDSRPTALVTDIVVNRRG